jgi:hypothetical protein
MENQLESILSQIETYGLRIQKAAELGNLRNISSYIAEIEKLQKQYRSIVLTSNISLN